MLRISVALIFCLTYQVNSNPLKEEFTWTYINYVWPENASLACPAVQKEKPPPQLAGIGDFVFPSYVEDPPKRGKYTFKSRNGIEEQTPEYIHENCIPMGANVYENKLFITVPRRRLGIPATLCYVDLNCPARKNVPLRPYPSWELNSLATTRPTDLTDPKTPFVSIYRVTVDQCNRLWCVDMGILEYPTGRQQIQQSTIIVIDLLINKVIRRYPLNENLANAAATLASITVDVTKDTCDDAFAYMTDLVNYKLLVYSWKKNKAWRVNHNYFSNDPVNGDFNIGGHEFQWDDGVFSVALSDVAPNGFRTAFFHSMASTKEFAVNTKFLRDEALATRRYHGNDFKVVGERGKNGQCSSHELKDGIFFMGLVNQNGLFCWNAKKGYLKHETLHAIHNDSTKMIYPSDLNIDHKDNIWMMTNSMPVFLYGKLDYKQENFRVWTSSIKNAIAGTQCE